MKGQTDLQKLAKKFETEALKQAAANLTRRAAAKPKATAKAKTAAAPAAGKKPAAKKAA